MPMEKIFSVPLIVKIRNSLPFMLAILAPPTSVDRVSKVAVKAAENSLETKGNVINVYDIQKEIV